jgi:hypothetical protein
MALALFGAGRLALDALVWRRWGSRQQPGL